MEWTTRKASQNEDFQLAIDYVVLCEDEPVLGVQVKPRTAMGKSDTLGLNLSKHEKCPFPVCFHVYDGKGELDPADPLVQSAWKTALQRVRSLDDSDKRVKSDHGPS